MSFIVKISFEEEFETQEQVDNFIDKMSDAYGDELIYDLDEVK